MKEYFTVVCEQMLQYISCLASRPPYGWVKGSWADFVWLKFYTYSFQTNTQLAMSFELNIASMSFLTPQNLQCTPNDKNSLNKNKK